MRFAPFYVFLVCLQPFPLQIDFPFRLLIFQEGGRRRSCKIDIRHVINRNVICPIELMPVAAMWMSRFRWISNASIPVCSPAHLSIASFQPGVFELSDDFLSCSQQETYLATALGCLSSCSEEHLVHHRIKINRVAWPGRGERKPSGECPWQTLKRLIAFPSNISSSFECDYSHLKRSCFEMCRMSAALCLLRLAPR